jgi:uncharacterized protein (TIGR03000 family)
MYSVVLATMLSVAPAPTPSWGCHGCGGCHGCCGGCHGCCGGCYGCCGGCCGGGCCGGYGACCGGYGGGCYGGYGCYGAYSWYGCSGCYGVFGCGGGYGGSIAPAVGGFGAARSPRDFFMSAAPMVAPAGPAAPPVAIASMDFPAPPAAPAVAARPVAPAPVASQVTVRLPANARLYVNDDLCPLTSDTRSFQTPQLKQEKEYSYTLRAEVERNGQTFTETRKVTFTAGKPVNVEFKEVGAVRTVAR